MSVAAFRKRIRPEFSWGALWSPNFRGCDRGAKHLLRFRIVSLAEMVLYGIVPGHLRKFVTITTFEVSPFSIPKVCQGLLTAQSTLSIVRMLVLFR